MYMHVFVTFILFKEKNQTCIAQYQMISTSDKWNTCAIYTICVDFSTIKEHWKL